MSRREIIGYIFGLVAIIVVLCGVCRPAEAAELSTWHIAVIVHSGDTDLDRGLLGSFPTKALCEAEIAKQHPEAKAKADAMGLEISAKCVEIPRKALPVIPKPKPTDGDGISLNGERRGQRT